MNTSYGPRACLLAAALLLVAAVTAQAALTPKFSFTHEFPSVPGDYYQPRIVPLYSHDLVFATYHTTGDSSVEARTVAGTLKWKTKVEGPVNKTLWSPCYDEFEDKQFKNPEIHAFEDTVITAYCFQNDVEVFTTVVALSTATGKVLWQRYTINGEIHQLVVDTSHAAVLVTTNAGFFGVDARKGHMLFAQGVTAPTLAAFDSESGVALVKKTQLPSWNTWLEGYDTRTGKHLWNRRLSDDVFDQSEPTAAVFVPPSSTAQNSSLFIVDLGCDGNKSTIALHQKDARTYNTIKCYAIPNAVFPSQVNFDASFKFLPHQAGGGDGFVVGQIVLGDDNQTDYSFVVDTKKQELHAVSKSDSFRSLAEIGTHGFANADGGITAVFPSQHGSHEYGCEDHLAIDGSSVSADGSTIKSLWNVSMKVGNQDNCINLQTFTTTIPPSQKLVLAVSSSNERVYGFDGATGAVVFNTNVTVPSCASGLRFVQTISPTEFLFHFVNDQEQNLQCGYGVLSLA